MDRTVIVENSQLKINGSVIELENIKFINILGKGANGIVFKAFDAMLERDIAIKFWLKKMRIQGTN